MAATKTRKPLPVALEDNRAAPEMIDVPLPKNLRANLTIMVAKCTDGFRAGHNLRGNTFGSLCGINLDGPSHPDRLKAISRELDMLPLKFPHDKRNAARESLNAFEASLTPGDSCPESPPAANGRANGVQTSTPGGLEGQEVCYVCHGKKKIDGFMCLTCGGFGFTVAAPGGSPATKRAEDRYDAAFPLKGIVRSPTNPRKTFDETKLRELAASIGQKGVLEPLLVRPTKHGDVVELIAGERRLRAAEIAGIKTVPVRIFDLNDVEALEVQTIENLQREDLDPIEEAEGYQQLLKRCGYTAESLAAKLGVSVGTIYASLKLLNLPDKARKALADGTIPVATAQLIGRIPNPKMRDEATKVILQGRFNNGRTLTFKEAKEYAEESLMRELKGAPFDPADASLRPAAGSCTDCRKRTGNDRVTYPDGRADICTDTACFDDKARASSRIKLQMAKDAGRPTLTDAQAKKVFNQYHAGELAWDAPYVDLDAKSYDTNNKTWRSVIGKDLASEVIVAVNPKTGRSHELVPKDKANRLLRKKLPRKDSSPKPSAADLEDARKRKAEAEIKGEVRRQAIVQAVAAARIEAGTLAKGPAFIRPLVAVLCGSDLSDEVLERRGFADASELYKSLSPIEAICFLVEHAIDMGDVFYRTNEEKQFDADLLSALSVDLEAIERQVRSGKPQRPEAKAGKKVAS